MSEDELTRPERSAEVMLAKPVRRRARRRLDDKRFILRSDQFDQTKEKICSACGQSKPCTLEFFPAKTSQPSRACAECKKCMSERSKRYRQKNLQRCKDASRKRARRWDQNNRERRIARDREKRKDPVHHARVVALIKKRRETLPAEAVRHRVGVQIRQVLRTRKGGRPTFQLLGYTADELIAHLERQFKRGMDWTKFRAGEIHIDHIVPISAFDFSGGDIAEVTRRAWALTNLRPMWAAENLRKGCTRTHLL